MTQAVVREFLAGSKYRVVSNPAEGDAVLHGEVIGLETTPVVFDPITGHATVMLIQVHMHVYLEDRATNKILYRNDNYLFRQEYEITSDITSFFDEQDPAARSYGSRFRRSTCRRYSGEFLMAQQQTPGVSVEDFVERIASRKPIPECFSSAMKPTSAICAANISSKRSPIPPLAIGLS